MQATMKHPFVGHYCGFAYIVTAPKSATCLVCTDNGENDELYATNMCQCKGDLTYFHQKCHQDYLLGYAGDGIAARCPTCKCQLNHSVIRTRTLWRSFCMVWTWQLSSYISSTLLSICVLSLIYLGVAYGLMNGDMTLDLNLFLCMLLLEFLAWFQGIEITGRLWIDRLTIILVMFHQLSREEEYLRIRFVVCVIVSFLYSIYTLVVSWILLDLCVCLAAIVRDVRDKWNEYSFIMVYGKN
jgi:hypothetical protein